MKATDTLPVNAMTVDVEDYFQVQAFAGCIKRDSWDDRPSRVEENTFKILDQFGELDVRATFFTLGWVADRLPAIVRRIVAEGHELASHGYGHQLVHELTPAEFLADVTRAKGVLEDVGGVEVRGYRAPTFSIGTRNLWAFDILAQTGHHYSSSVYPIHHDLYGNSRAPRFPYRPTNAPLLEFPMSTLRIGTKNLPISGGGYFRLLPYPLFRSSLRRFCSSERRPAIFYFHPWEIDVAQPRISQASYRSKFRHYFNISSVSGRLDRLLRDFRWGRMDEVFASDLASH